MTAVRPQRSSKEFGYSSSNNEFGPVVTNRRTLRHATTKQLHDEVERDLVHLQRLYEREFARLSDEWLCGGETPHQPPIDVAAEVGVPGPVLGAILIGKCKDQRIGINSDRQRRFADWMHTNCSSLWFNMGDSSAGPLCAQGVCLALKYNDRFTSLNLSNNHLGDVGAATVARMLPEHISLVHVDLSANDIGHHGANTIFEALLTNRSVTSLDLSSKASASLRNHLSKHNATWLEKLMLANPVLSKLVLQGTHLGADGIVGLSRGLVANTTLSILDVAGCDLGARGAAALADALPTCAVEELNLSDNRIGDEGMMAMANCLGAPPVDQVGLPPNAPASPTLLKSGTLKEGLRNMGASSGMMMSEADPGPASAKGLVSKYRQTLEVARASILDLNPMVLAGVADTDEKADQTFAAIKSNFDKLYSAIDRSQRVPRLRVLNLANNGGTAFGVGRIEDALQVNDRLERLVMDHCDHRAGVRSLLGALPVNKALKHLSLANCRIGQAGSIELSKVLPLSPFLESLCLKGNEVSPTAAAALGGVLSLPMQHLRMLNLNSCHLSDESGVLLANGLTNNQSMEVLQLRDNALREGSGRAFVEMMRKHTIMLTLNLELNSIDFRFLTHISQLLERNAKLKEKAKPDQYRKRIEQLEECQRRVEALSHTLRHNDARKAEATQTQLEAQQELEDAIVEERRKGQQLEARLEEVRRSRRAVDDEVAMLEETLRKVSSEGEYEVSQLSMRLGSVDDRIVKHEKRIEQAKVKLTAFEEKAQQELAAAQEELDKAEKGRNSASKLAAAAQRNLDNYTSSLKAIEENVSGAADPRRRFVEKGSKERPKSGGRSGAKSKKSPSRPGSASAGTRKVKRTAASPDAAAPAAEAAPASPAEAGTSSGSPKRPRSRGASGRKKAA